MQMMDKVNRMDREISLTHEGLSRLGFVKDFVIHANSPENNIFCSRSQILFISPIISKLRYLDPTVDEFKLETKNSSKCSSIFQSLLDGDSIKVTKDLIGIFNSIAVELGSVELLHFIEDDLKVNNIFEIVEFKIDQWMTKKYGAGFFQTACNEFKVWKRFV